jgi:hypothetical protein
VLAILQGVWAIRPRLWSNKRRAFVSWLGIVKLQSRRAFSSEFRRLSDDELETQLEHHVYELSVVCAAKYFWVSASILTAVAGGILAALVVGLKPG